MDKYNSPYVKQITVDGINNTVLTLKPHMDLGKIGFSDKIKVEDLNVLAHGLDNKDDFMMFQALCSPKSKALLSTSYVNYGKGNTRLFRTQGFILDVPSSHIQAGYWRDFGSGCGKNERDLFSTYLFSNIEQRTYFSNQLKRHLHLSDSEYIKLIEKIEDLSIYELEQQHPNVAKAYRKIIHEADVSKRTYGRNYNEVLVNNPKVQAIFCYDQSPRELPAYMRRFAQKNNIPIIVF